MSIEHERPLPGPAAACAAFRRARGNRGDRDHSGRVHQPVTADPEASIAVVDPFRWITAGSPRLSMSLHGT